ncbi:MAG: purine-nucleoside phosphorylase [Clostridiales bacterium]|nr:purine-nucleoside phosphorylase [Clostridiales bacterium]
MSGHIGAIGADKGAIAEGILLPGDPLRAKFIAENFLEEPVLFNEVRGMLGYTGRYKGVPVSVMGTGMGMPSMGLYSWELMEFYGVQKLIRIGTAGSFHEDVKVRDIVLGVSASTDSNYAHAFNLPGTYSPAASMNMLLQADAAAKKLGLEYKAGNILSGDVFYELGDEWWKKWQSMGTLAVEMEAAALYMNAAYHRRDALTILTISNHFVTGEETTNEEREKTFTDMMKLALETVTA